jgi:hypothetical protein
MIILQVGDFFLWSLISLLIHRYCFNGVWTPLPDGGCGGNFPNPTYLVRGIHGGGEKF